METLFGQSSPPPAPARERHPGPFAAIAIEQSVDRTLDYAIPARWASTLKPGMRVRVPLGRNNKPAYGYVVAVKPAAEVSKVKELLAVADERVLVPPTLMELSRWISRYYIAPLGIVLESVIPSAVKKRVGVGYSQIVRLLAPREQVQALLEKTKAPKRRAILARLLLLEPEHSIELTRLAGDASATPPTVRKLAGMGLISITAEPDMEGSGEGSGLRVRGSGEGSGFGVQGSATAGSEP
jgi:primosomal protein N' (replication factor Y) (superfamily II helicase)